MFSNRVFQIAFLISLFAHGVILFQNPNLNFLPTNKKTEKLEVSYIREPEKAPEYKRPALPKREPFLKIPSKISANKPSPPPFVDKENIFKDTAQGRSNPISVKPNFIKPDIIAVKKKITLPPIDMDKISNPSYINYYQLVREKIKRAAYQNYLRTEVGEVYLSFVVSCDGYIKEVRLVEEKSSDNPYLNEIALRSVRDASPFPNFPKELDYPQLSFNAVISFEIE